MKDDDLYYVGIQNAQELRKLLLYTSRDVISLLQNFERIMELRKAKLDAVAKLRQELDEIAELSQRIKKELPQVTLPERPAFMLEQTEPAAAPARGKTSQSKPGKSSSFMDRLDKELSEIEEKIKTLE